MMPKPFAIFHINLLDNLTRLLFVCLVNLINASERTITPHTNLPKLPMPSRVPSTPTLPYCKGSNKVNCTPRSTDGSFALGLILGTTFGLIMMAVSCLAVLALVRHLRSGARIASAAPVAPAVSGQVVILSAFASLALTPAPNQQLSVVDGDAVSVSERSISISSVAIG